MASAGSSAEGALSIWDEKGFAGARWCVQEAFHAWAGGGLWSGAL